MSFAFSTHQGQDQGKASETLRAQAFTETLTLGVLQVWDWHLYDFAFVNFAYQVPGLPHPSSGPATYISHQYTFVVTWFLSQIGFIYLNFVIACFALCIVLVWGI